MRKKIDTLMKRYNEDQAKRARLQKEIDTLKKQQEDLNKQAEAAAEKGLDEEYLSLKDQANRAGALVHVRETVLNKTGVVSKEEAAAAWEDYVGSYNTEFDKAVKDYAAARRTLAENLIHLTEMQTPAFRIREMLDVFTGENALQNTTSHDVNSTLPDYPMHTLNQLDYIADFRFFLAAGAVSKEENERMGRLTHQHRS